MTDLITIKALLQESMPALRMTFPLRRLGVFGSVARGEATAASDVDILVELERPIGLFQFIELEDRLRELLHRDVDAVTANALKPMIKDAILREAIYV
jgi:predicted nucleotidyltransferase